MLSAHSWSSAMPQRQAGWLPHVSALGLSVSQHLLHNSKARALKILKIAAWFHIKVPTGEV